MSGISFNRTVLTGLIAWKNNFISHQFVGILIYLFYYILLIDCLKIRNCINRLYLKIYVPLLVIIRTNTQNVDVRLITQEKNSFYFTEFK